MKGHETHGDGMIRGMPHFSRNKITKRPKSFHNAATIEVDDGVRRPTSQCGSGHTGRREMNAMVIHQDLAAQLAFERAENERLREALAKKGQNGGGRITMKVTEKGCVGLYGLGRFPVVLYAGQWLKIFAIAKDVVAFIESNRDRLAWKD
jgi:hypothetical protein